MNRRSFLGLLGGAAAGATLAGCGLGTAGQTGEQLVTAARLPKPFQVPLPIPPVARQDSAGLYRVTQRVAQAEILPGLRTEILGYDGIFPGPTFETRRGRPVVVRHRNELPVPTVVHLHGGHTPHEHDGWPLDLVLPVGNTREWRTHHGTGTRTEGERDYRYPMAQRAATLWYHDHRMDFTGPAVYRGLAGFHLVRDDEEDQLPLPRDDRELPLMICDRAFEEDGSFAYPALDEEMRSVPGVRNDWMEGVLGDVVLVNGAPWPVHEVDAARYRLRLLNASNARRYRLELSVPGGPNLPMTQIGSDGGLLAAPVTHQSIELAPGERFDVVVDFSRVLVGTEVTMVNGLGSGGTANVLRFHVVRTARDDSRVPDRLSEIEPLTPNPGAPTRTFRFTRGPVGDHRGWTINGTSFAPGSSLADSKLGEVETWRLITDVHHPVHVHLDPFQVLRRDGRAPGKLDGGWKDTVDIRPAEVVDIAVRFTDYAGKFVMHCHNLEHEDMAMMATIRTVT
ncbi:multicopper oxidase family protein [Actinophytocola algeriensis]|uniref:Multicopper oxidase CueO n=1 Tax=Actinophytocola algeriensis TaxID=1768010 RepID=A0A7W7Q952_9PSEU|nr:multicopper oxidase domain-containing protein [Actinophytocola algeriensis]MBB4909310.1 FtsP/CotA-like multicopper oxidase with cupredoxin domain [Actinophytocola algeriensis]MBE1475300.1 FtsP/CotA-like multicopper oxidase with cupredoxin domain [Actinophytocola algeriensis]